MKKKRIRRMNLYLCDNKYLVSYDTLVGVVDYDNNTLHEWGYGNYSSTTSRQITIFTRLYGLERIHYDNITDYYYQQLKLF